MECKTTTFIFKIKLLVAIFFIASLVLVNKPQEAYALRDVTKGLMAELDAIMAERGMDYPDDWQPNNPYEHMSYGGNDASDSNESKYNNTSSSNPSFEELADALVSEKEAADYYSNVSHDLQLVGQRAGSSGGLTTFTPEEYEEYKRKKVAEKKIKGGAYEAYKHKEAKEKEKAGAQPSGTYRRASFDDDIQISEEPIEIMPIDMEDTTVLPLLPVNPNDGREIWVDYLPL